MDYLKVALRTDLAAEDTSQAAPHAIIHLIGPLSNATFCGKVGVRDLAHAGTDRVVSCPDCLSFSRSMRDTPADHTSLTESAYRTLRSVSGPDYTGLERRSRPRFIEADLTIDQLTDGGNMKKYTNVIKDDVGSVHALYDGESATACGAINAADTMGSARAVSCDACMKAIINQQRASDHRVAVQLVQEMQASGDAELLGQLRQMCGYVENGSSEYITIGQDDATREWTLSIGDSHARATGKARRYSGTSFHQAIRAAAAKEIEVEEPQAHGYADQDTATIPHFDHKGDLPPVGAVGVSADAVVEANRKLLLDRSNVGIAKYGVTLEQSGLTLRQFVQHALEETLDLANYLQATLMTTALKEEKQ